MNKVKLNLRDASSTEETPIYAVFRYNGIRLKHFTGERIKPKYWNDQEQRAKQTSAFPENPEFNRRLENVQTHIRNTYRGFREKGKIPTLLEFREELQVRLLQLPRESLSNLSDFAQTFIQSAVQNQSKKANTIKDYNCKLKFIEQFAKDKKVSLEFNDIDQLFYDRLINYIYTDKKHSINYAGSIIKVLKTFLSAATIQGKNTNLAYKQFTKPVQEVDSIYLTKFELEAMYRLDLSGNKKFELIRDLFIVGAFTGLRFSDFTQIRNEYLKTITDDDGATVQVISIPATVKTEEPVVIPVHPYVKAILEKHKDQKGDTNYNTENFNTRMNKALKKIGAKAKIKDMATITTSKAGKKVEIHEKKCKLISTHTARRSFATNAFKDGISSVSIMKITGHKTERAFLRYIKVTKEENAILMAKNPFFNPQVLKAV